MKTNQSDQKAGAPSAENPLRRERFWEAVVAGANAGVLAALLAAMLVQASGRPLFGTWNAAGFFLCFLAIAACVVSIIFFLRRFDFKTLLRNAKDAKLAGVLDRGSFFPQLQQEMRRAGRYHYPLTLCLLDLDDFNQISRLNGKYYADEVLLKFAAITLSHIRTSDILCRVGRDEFWVLLAHTDLTQAEKFLYRLYLQIQERLDVSYSAGITSYRPGETREEFLHRSEEALTRAKQEGQRKTRCVICKDDSLVVMNFDFGRIAE